MGRNSKNKGVGCPTRPAKPGVDGLSRLPDTILLNILSRLPTEDVVRAGLLSRRWKLLWASVPCLDFELRNSCRASSRFHRHYDIGECSMARCKVNMVLFSHKQAPISKLRLSLKCYCEEFFHPLNQWIEFCARRQLQELHLVLSIGKYPSLHQDLDADSSSITLAVDRDGLPYPIPIDLFAYCQLRVLQLQCCQVKPHPTMNFQSVEVLSLTRIDAAEETFHQLFSSCPVLKHLSLEGCKNLRHVELSNLHLATLKFICCHRLTRVKIDAPLLCSLEYTGCLHGDLHFGLNRSLGHLHTKLGSCGYELGCQKDGQDSRIWDIMEEVAPTEVLELNCYFKDLILTAKRRRQNQSYNVKTLKLACCMQDDAALITSEVLTRFPMLEELHLHLISPTCEQEDGRDPFLVKRISADCLPQNLKVITISGFRVRHNEVELARFLVENAMVLQKMYISCSKRDYSQHAKIKGKLLSWRACPNAEISCTKSRKIVAKPN